MRIAVDARLLSIRDTGSSVYCRALLRALAGRRDGHEYHLLCQPGAAELMALDGRFHWRELVEARLMDEAWDQLVLPGLVEDLKPDVYLGLSTVLPAVKTCPQATIVHDVGVQEEPGFYSSALHQYLSRWLRAAVEQADLVLAVSQFTRVGVQRVYGAPISRIEVVYPAPEELFWPRPQGEERDRVLGRYGLVGPYLLTTAALGSNKNLAAILQAYHLAGGRAALGQPLVVVGGPGGAEASLQWEVERLGLSDDVVLAGYLPREHLPALYSGTTCFLWASLYEGFGLPPVEAMACGAPVISSNRAAMPEVLGEAAVLVDPSQPAAMASALRLVVESEEMRRRLRLAGLKRAAQFTWGETTGRVLEGLARIAYHG